MHSESADIIARIDALLNRLQRHSMGKRRLTEFEIRSVLNEIEAIKMMNYAASLPASVLSELIEQ